MQSSRLNIMLRPHLRTSFGKVTIWRRRGIFMINTCIQASTSEFIRGYNVTEIRLYNERRMITYRNVIVVLNARNQTCRVVVSSLPFFSYKENWLRPTVLYMLKLYTCLRSRCSKYTKFIHHKSNDKKRIF